METLQQKKTLIDTDFEVKPTNVEVVTPWWANIKFLFAGILFGIILLKSEVISWFRIQEMFRLQSFQMFLVLGSAVVTGVISVWLFKKLKIRTINGETITFPVKKFQKGQVFGGLMFGFGWALTGACPGPLFAQIGSGMTVVIITTLSAVVGTWVYGRLQHKLPH